MAEVQQKGHPKGLYVLFVTEMWERFSYYGMRGIFVLFMIKALLFDKALASEIYGNYTGLVYLTPLLGGYIADRYWGNRKSIFWGGILMAVGQFMLFGSALMYESIASATSPGLGHMLFYGGLGFLIFGNGFFKPNISTMVGQLYPKGDTRLDSAMTIFYMGINLGAFIAPLVAGGFGDTGCPADFKWGFLAAAVGMIISIITFELLKNKYVVTPDGEAVGMPPSKAEIKEKIENDLIDTIEEAKKSMDFTQLAIYIGLFAGLFSLFNWVLGLHDMIGAGMYSLAIVAPLSIYMDKSLSKIEKDRILVIYICAAFVIFFWSAFEQAGASLTFFAEEQTNREVFGWTMPASFFQSFNALFIVVFAPIAAWLWTYLGKKNMEPASPYKQSIGLFLLAVGYLFIAFGVRGVDPSMKVSMFWLVGLYWLHTMGELSLSPIGLSMVVKLSPTKFTSLLMGIWFLSMATSNKLAGVLSSFYPEEFKKEATLEMKDDALYKDVNLTWFDSQVGDISQLNTWSVAVEEKDDEKMLSALTASSAEAQTLEEYKARRILKNNKLYAEPKPDDQDAEPASKCETVDELGKFAYGFNTDGSEMYIIRDVAGDKTMQMWNLRPQRPSIFGWEVKTLFDFFMIFVVLAGVSSVILFFLSKKLIKMMHDVR